MVRNVFDEDDNSWGKPQSKSIWDLDEEDDLEEEVRPSKFKFKLNPKIAAISGASILGIAVLASVVPGLLSGGEEPKPEPTAVQTSTAPVSWQEQMLSSLNTIRADNGLEPLKLCNTLNKSAQSYAEEMAAQNFLAHEGKDGSTPSQRGQSAGYGVYVGENIAAGQRSIEEVMTGWTNSPGHFKNMINSEYMHVGFGMASNQETTYKTWWVQNFGFEGECG
jgi:uncharacterized protein YkwD